MDCSPYCFLKKVVWRKWLSVFYWSFSQLFFHWVAVTLIYFLPRMRSWFVLIRRAHFQFFFFHVYLVKPSRLIWKEKNPFLPPVLNSILHQNELGFPPLSFGNVSICTPCKFGANCWINSELGIIIFVMTCISLDVCLFASDFSRGEGEGEADISDSSIPSGTYLTDMDKASRVSRIAG